MIDSQRPGFEELYQAVYTFFQDEIRRDPSPWNHIRLQMMTQYFDDLALYKVMNPIVARIQSNPEDRRAIARAALWDALLAHQNGKFVDMTVAAMNNPKRPDYRLRATEKPEPIPFTVEQTGPAPAVAVAAPAGTVPAAPLLNRYTKKGKR